MFKVLLIVYVLGGGGSENVKNTYNTNFVFQEFYSMADCELAVTEMEDLLTWNRTADGTEEKDMISVLYSTKCVEMTATAPSWRPSEPATDASPPLPNVEPIPRRKQSRWND